MSTIQTRKEFYAHTFTHNTFLLHCIVTYYKRYMYNIPEKVFSSLHPNIHVFLLQKPYLALHENFFLQRYGIGEKKEENFSPLPARVGLLPKDYLAHTVLTLGMTLCHEDIATTVLKKDVQALRQLESLFCMPHEKLVSPYTFALQKASNYQGHCQHVRQQIDQHAHEQAFTAHFHKLDLDERVLAWGLWALFSCTAQGGTPLTLRTALLLDALCSYAAPLSELKEFFCNTGLQTTQPLAWPLLRVLLFKEIHCPWEEGWPVFFA